MSRRQRAEPKRRSRIWVAFGLAIGVGFAGFQWIASSGRDPFEMIRRGYRPEPPFFRDPIGLDEMPEVPPANLGAAERSDAQPREVTGHVALHDGSPARDLEYWLVSDPHLPEAELRGELALGCLLKPAGKSLGRTDGQGRFAGFVAADRPVALVVRVHANLTYACVLGPADATLSLPALAWFELRCDGIEKGSTLRVKLTPAFRRPGFLTKTYGGARDYALPPTESGDRQPAASKHWAVGMLGEDQRIPWTGEPVRVLWPAGQPANVAADGIGFDLTPGSAILEAPAQLSAVLGRRFRIATVKLDDPARAGGAGFAVLSKKPDPKQERLRFALGTEPLRFDLRSDEDTTYVIDVVDAQLRRERVELKEKDLPESGVIDLAAASASAPLTVTLPSKPGIERAQLHCETGDKLIVPLTPIDRYRFQIDEYGCWAGTGPGRFVLADPPKAWRQLFVVLPSGEVAALPATSQTTLEAAWLPSKDAGPIDLQKLVADHLKGKAGAVDFIVYLKSLEGVDQIVSADRLEIAASPGHLPRWSKRIAKGLVARLVFQIPEEMLEELPLPLEGR